ncbi:hypothetical protein MPER_09264 [Moniliophthora perniciosa FA553]|nr:hypothetical protein MPER_09264 [Moniliophthora perniciosa FA553]
MPSSTFGVPLEDIMGYEGEKGGIPRVVRDAIQFLRETGMQEDGLFRRSPSSAMLRAAQEAYDRGNVVSLDTFGDPHLAAVLLKKYLRDLPEPIFPESLYPAIRRCPMPTPDPGDMSAVMYVRDVLLPELPPCVYILLSHILPFYCIRLADQEVDLMHEVSLHAAMNRMDAHNLSIVLCPNLVKGTNPAKDVMMCTAPGGPQQQQPQNNTTLGTVIKLCIHRYYEIFDEVHDRTEVVGQETHEDVQYDKMVGGEGRGVFRGFGYGVDMELSESESEAEGEAILGGVGYGRGGQSGYTSTSSTFGLASLQPGVVWEGGSADGHGSLNGHGSVEDYDESQEVRLQHHRRQSSGKHSIRTNGTDEEIDDTMLVMPIGPAPSSPRSPEGPQTPTLGNTNGHSPTAWSPSSPPTPMAWGGHGPPSSWVSGGAGVGASRFTTVGANYATYKSKSRRAPPNRMGVGL